MPIAGCARWGRRSDITSRRSCSIRAIAVPTSISVKPTWCLAIRPRPSSTSRIWKTSASSAARSTTTSSGRSRGIRGWWLAEERSAGGRITVGLPARVDPVLRFGREIAGVMPLAQLFFRPPADAVDHSPALDGRALADFFRPARQVLIFVRLQELARIVVGGAVQHAVAVPRPDRHIGDRIFVAGDETIVRKALVEHIEQAFHLHCKTVDGVFDLHRSIGIEMPEAAADIGR